MFRTLGVCETYFGVPNFAGSIAIGAPVSMSCANQSCPGQSSTYNGIEFFESWINSKSRGLFLNGSQYRVNLQLTDDISNESYLLNALLNMNTRYYFGPFGSLTTTALNYTEHQSKLLISSTLGANFFSNSKLGFGILPPNSSYGTVLFQFLKDMNVKNLTVLDDESSLYCNELEYVRLASQFGIQMVNYYRVRSMEDLEKAIFTISYGSTEVVFGCSTMYHFCIDLVYIAKNIKYSPKGIVFSDCLSFNEVRESLGQYAENLFGVQPWSPDDLSERKSSITGYTAATFSSSYYHTFLQYPTFYSASAFSVGEMLISAIEIANSTDVVNVANALRNNIFSTLISDISVSDPTSTFPLSVVQLQSGLQKVIYHNNSFVQGAHIQYPMLTWDAINCNVLTSNCNGHGYCSSAGNCVCQQGYYGEINLASCDTFCNGTYNSSSSKPCIANNKFFIGGFISSTQSKVENTSNEYMATYTNSLLPTIGKGVQCCHETCS